MKLSFITLFACSLFSVQAFASENTLLNLELNLTVFDSDCGNANNGAITSIVSGGVPPYTYEWSNGETTAGIVDLAPGSYSLTVTDAAQNEITASGNVGQEDSDIDLYLAASYETCEGSCDGNVSVNASGGSGNFTYQWDDPNNTTFVVVENACAGIYTVTVTDDEGCSAVESIELELSPEGIWLMTSGTDATCGSNNNGTAHVSIMTGVAPYTIVWSDGQMGEDITGLAAGTYTVTVTDVNGCSNTDEVTIGQGASTIELNLAASYETCEGSCDGNVSVNASGGSGNFTYQWDDPNNTTFVVVENACAGVYTVTVTDDEGCSAVGSIELELSPEGVWLMTTQTNVTCNGGNDGTAHVSVMSGAAPYQITWNTNPPQMGEDAVNLSAGTYTVTAVDANGCSNSEQVTILEPSAIEVVLNSTENTDCGLGNGSINITASGGTAPYTYEWSNGATTEDLENLESGIYTVTITDDNDCTVVEGPIEVEEIGGPEITVDNVTPATCGLENGSIEITVSGGAAPYTYEWSNGTTTEDLENLESGSYTVTVTDDNACTAVAGPIEVEETGGPEITVDNVTPATCGLENGSIEITVSGGTAPYTYEWSNGATTEDLENLESGSYTVTVTDDNACTAVAGPIEVEETGGPEITVDNVTPATCGLENGSIEITVSGGAAPYSYEWSNGATTEDLENLESGSYTVTVTDDNDCTAVTGPIEVEETDGPEITVDNVTPATCGLENGSIEITVSGGAAPYSYEWSNGATTEDLENLESGSYTVTVTDDNDCTAVTGPITVDEIPGPTITVDEIVDAECDMNNGSINISVSGGTLPYVIEWSNGDNTEDINDLAPGDYTVTVTDANDCSVVMGPITVDQEICCVDPVVASVVVIETSCADSNGIATIQMVGDNSDYTYTWNPDIGMSNTIGNSQTGLPTGIYSVTIVDILNNPDCPIVETFTVGTVGGPLAFEVTTTPATCEALDGTAELEFNPNFTYLWCNGATIHNPTNLPAGDCAVIVTDTTTGCTDTRTVTIDEFNPLAIGVTVNNEPDCGVANGSVTVDVSGAGPNYTYLWSNGNTSETATNLSSGFYCVTATDVLTNCMIDTCFVLNDIVLGGAVIVITEPVSTTCIGSDDATVEYTVNYDPAFVQPADTIIQNTMTGDTAVNGSLAPGNYCIIITDGNGCISSNNCFDVVEPSQIDVDIAVTNTCDPFPGIEIVETLGGTAPYTYDWCDLPGTDNPEDRPDLETGTYCVTVTDFNGCTAVADDLMIIDTCACPPMIISSVVVVETECDSTSGQATVTVVDAATMNLEYDWSITPDPNSPTAMNLGAGSYSVTITNLDRPECSIIEEFSVGTSNGPETTHSVTPTVCGMNVGEVEFSNPSFSYQWSDGAFPSIRTGLSVGTYFVTITDPSDTLNCIDIKTVVIEEEPSFNASFMINNNPDCGASNGSVTIMPNDTGSYSYSWGNFSTVDNLTSGIYEVTVTDNATQCTSTTSFVLVNVDVDAMLNVEAESFTSCPGVNDGTIIYNEADLTDYTVQIMDLDSNIHVNGSLAPGVYCVLVTDDDECVAGGDCVEVRSPGQIDVDVAIYNELCGEPGEIQLVEILGGTPFPAPGDPYTIEWSNGDMDAIAENLDAGSYTFTVRDANACFVTETVTVKEDINEIDIEIVGNTLICENTTTLCVDTDDNVVWTNEDGTDIGNMDCVEISETGTYYVEVSNDFCADADTVEVMPDELIVPLSDTTVCFGSINVPLNSNATSSEYVYQWSPANALDDPSSSNPLATTNVTTTFEVIISDSLGNCSDTSTVFLEVTDEVMLIASADSTIYCGENTATLTATGNGSNYTWYSDAGLQNQVGAGAVLENMNSVPESGNDNITYYVETELDGCTNLDSVVISNQGFTVEIEGDVEACEGDVVTLSPVLTLSGSEQTGGVFTYTWSGPGIDNVTAEEVIVTVPAGVSSYIVEVENDYCLDESSNNFNISAPDFSSANAIATPDTILLSETSDLEVPFNDGWNYEWQDDVSFITETNISNPTVQPEETTEYLVNISQELENGEECADTRTVTVTVQTFCEEPYIFFPNAFSPNNDGFNDELLLRGNGVTEVFFAIYDRWGEKVFESNSQNVGWDGTFKGKELSPDVYGFYLRVRCGNGEEFYKQGNVTLFR